VRSEIIAIGDVPRVFNDGEIVRLAKTAGLPVGANVAVFAEGIREAARIYVRDALTPNANELHDEIAYLYETASDHEYDAVAVLLDNLSPQAREILVDQGVTKIRLTLPSREALLDPRLREAACESVARLCLLGERRVPGRRRPSGKRSRPTIRPLLQAPEPRRNFPKRDVERHFVMGLQLAYLEAMGTKPPLTARHADDSRSVGPFARFAAECLRLVGAIHADVVGLINELHRAFIELEGRSGRVGPRD
jgi:hypothetical protein